MKYKNQFALATTIAVSALLLGASDARASNAFASSIQFWSGSSTGEDPNKTLGAPDAEFTQLVDQFGSLVLDFGQLLSAPGTLTVYTFDDLFPAAVQVDVSADAGVFSTVTSLLWDTNGTYDPIGPTYPHA